MFSTCIMGIWNILIMLLGAAVAFAGWWLTGHSINGLPNVYVPATNSTQQQFKELTNMDPVHIDMNDQLSMVTNHTAVPLLIAGIVVFVFGILGCIAFQCKVRFLAILYVILMVLVIMVEYVWGAFCIIDGGKDKFPFINDKVHDKISDIFTGRIVDGWSNGFYCMDLSSYNVPKEYFPYTGYFTGHGDNNFIEEINKIDGMKKCEAPTATSNCQMLQSECEDNLIHYLTNKIWIAGIIVVVIATVQLLIMFVACYATNKMGAKKEEKKEREQARMQQQTELQQYHPATTH